MSRLIALMLFCLFSCLDSPAQEPARMSLTFRSELWQQEYRKRQQQENELDILPSSQQVESATAQAASSEKHRDTGFSGGNGVAGSINIADLAAPGQPELIDLQQQTPIEEWQVDKQLASAVAAGSYRNVPNDWQLSKSGDGTKRAKSLAKGPTATTYLVGFMACIVVCGALMTGRDV